MQGETHGPQLSLGGVHGPGRAETYQARPDFRT